MNNNIKNHSQLRSTVFSCAAAAAVAALPTLVYECIYNDIIYDLATRSTTTRPLGCEKVKTHIIPDNNNNNVRFKQ